MTQLRIYKRAVINFSEEDAAALSMMMTRTNSEGEVVELPPDFPLQKAQAVFNGANATITVPQTNRKNRRVCHLTDAKLTEPRSDKDPIIIEGTCSELVSFGFSAEESRVSASIVEYATCATCR